MKLTLLGTIYGIVALTYLALALGVDKVINPQFVFQFLSSKFAVIFLSVSAVVVHPDAYGA